MLSDKQVSEIMSKDIPRLLHARIDELEAALKDVAAHKYELASMLDSKIGCDKSSSMIKASADRIMKLVDRGVKL